MDVASPRYVGPKATVQLILEELEDLPNWSANSTQQPFFASPACGSLLWKVCGTAWRFPITLLTGFPSAWWWRQLTVSEILVQLPVKQFLVPSLGYLDGHILPTYTQR